MSATREPISTAVDDDAALDADADEEEEEEEEMVGDERRAEAPRPRSGTDGYGMWSMLFSIQNKGDAEDDGGEEVVNVRDVRLSSAAAAVTVLPSLRTALRAIRDMWLR